VPPIRERAPHLPPYVADAIDRAVALEAAKRPTASELADLLAGASTQTGTSHAATPGFMPPTASTGRVGDAATAVSMTSIGHVGHVGPAATVARAPRRPLRWQPWAVVGALLLAVVLAIALRGDNKPASIPGAAGPARAGEGDSEERENFVPPEFNVAVPQAMDGKQAKDWQKLIDELQQGDFASVRDRLDGIEARYGQSRETQHLRDQLDQLPEHVYERGRGPKKHKN
jgi:hypothetical protein